MNVTLDEESHVYTDRDGLTVPGCTGIIAGLQSWIGIPVDVLEHASARGRAVHEETAIMDELECVGDKYHYDDLDPELMPYVFAWETFKRELKFTPNWIEKTVTSKRHRCAGQMDRAGIAAEICAAQVLIDIKCVAALSPATGVQLAGYRMMFNEGRKKGDQIQRRFAVQLKPDATYRIKEYKGSNDQAVFLGALSIHNWRLENDRSYNTSAD